jgi:hypothetical protein
MSKSETKTCRECGVEKDIEEFAPNQYGKNNRVLRRPVCRDCYSRKVKMDPKKKKDFEKRFPRPEIGEEFTCPICQKTFTRKHKNDVVLDHNHNDGTIRGWTCSSCNTSMGKFHDSPNIIRRALNWVLSNGKKLKSILSSLT